MNDIGISLLDGAVYEGNSTSIGFRLHPAPLLLPFRLESTVVDVPGDYSGPSLEIFREDSFDPATKLRRGRIYSRRHLTQPFIWHVQDSFRNDLPLERWGMDTRTVTQTINLTTYRRDPLTELRKQATRLPKVILGAEPFLAFWKIISIENTVSDVPLLTLKAIHSLGDMPELIENQVPKNALRMLTASWEHLDDSINRSSPASVVDRCRDVLSVVFGHLAEDPTRDLGYSINEFVRSKNSDKEDLKTYAGRIVCRLHSRGKPNEQEAHSLQPLSDEHAQLAVRCVGLVLVDLGWAH